MTDGDDLPVQGMIYPMRLSEKFMLKDFLNNLNDIMKVIKFDCLIFKASKKDKALPDNSKKLSELAK